MNAEPHVIRTNNFVADAAAFILELARKAIAERNEFRIALSGGNTPAPVYARIAVDAHDLPWESVRFTFGCRSTIRSSIFSILAMSAFQSLSCLDVEEMGAGEIEAHAHTFA